MHRRSVLAALALLAMLGLAGCLGGVGSGISERALAENTTYDWQTNATTEIELTTGGFFESAEYHVVYSGNASTLTLSMRGFTRPHAVDIRAVKFRYANGTVVGHEAVGVSQSSRATTIRLPEEDGKLAFSGRRRDQELHVRTFDQGSVRVILPENHTVGDLLLSDVVPRDYERRQTEDGRVALYWDSVPGDEMVLVRHYRQWHRLLFWGLVGVLGIAAMIGYFYFSRQIDRIQRVREEHGLDLDDDDEGDRPPPGMG